MKKSLSVFFATIIVTLGLSISLQSLFAAWTAPVGTPPNCNTGDPGCDAPLNMSATTQQKAGSLILNTTGNTNGLIVDQGKVGVGMPNPGGKLSVKSDGVSTYPFRVYASDGGDMGYFWEDAGQHTIFDLFNGAGVNNIRLNTNGNSWLLGTNVGIGTNNPAEKLEVNINNQTTNNWPLIIRNEKNANAMDYDVGMKFKFSNDSTANEQNKWAGIKAFPESNWANSIGLAFYTKHAVNGPTEIMRINSLGNVAIGTTTPANAPKFTVANSSNLWTRFHSDTYGWSLLEFLNETGRAFMGVDSRWGGGLMPGTTPYAGAIGVRTAHPLYFGTNDTIRMTISSNGNVGIGANDPQTKLDVNGQIKSRSGGFVFPDGTTQTTAASGVTKSPAVYSCPVTGSNTCKGQLQTGSTCMYNSTVSRSCTFVGYLVQ